jgi:hypothetical protein
LSCAEQGKSKDRFGDVADLAVRGTLGWLLESRRGRRAEPGYFRVGHWVVESANEELLAAVSAFLAPVRAGRRT